MCFWRCFEGSSYIQGLWKIQEKWIHEGNNFTRQTSHWNVRFCMKLSQLVAIPGMNTYLRVEIHDSCMDLVFISLYRHVSTMFASYRDTCSPCHKWNGPIENIFESSATNQLLLFCCLKLQLDSSSKRDLSAHLDSDKEFATSLQNPKKWIALGPDMHKLRGWFGCTRIYLPGCIIGQVCHFSGAELSPVVLIPYGLVFHRPPARVPKKPIRFYFGVIIWKKHLKTHEN